MHRTKLVLSMALLVATLVPSLIVQAGQSHQDDDLNDLWFGTLMSPSLVDWFNQVARPDDVASIKAGGVDLLSQLTAGKRQVVIASAVEAEQLIPSIADQVEIIGYDIEHWPLTPADEQADPVAAVQRMQELAQTYGLELAVGPDRRYAMEYGAEMAPYADRFILQLQRLQDDPDRTLEFTQPLIQELRQANPDLQISVVFRPQDNVDQLLALVDLLKDDIDGVSILSTPATVDSVKAFVERLRSGELATLATPTVAATPTAAPTLPPTATAAPLPIPTPPPCQCTWPTGIVLAGSGLTALLMQHRRRGVS